MINRTKLEHILEYARQQKCIGQLCKIPPGDMVEIVEMAMRKAGNSPVTPDGWVIVPKKLTAENGAKGVLSGEFSETTFISCPECFGDDDCDTCDGSGRIEIKVPVTWTTIKSIWDKGIAYFAAEPPQEEKSGNADCTDTSGKTDNPQASGKQVNELTMLVKQLVSQLKKAKPDCKLPDKAMDYLKRNGLISVEDILR
ncbi:hypothetical protein AAEU23_004937 [Escherichia coli]